LYCLEMCTIYCSLMDVKIPRKRKERIKLRKTTKRLIALPTSSAVTTRRIKKKKHLIHIPRYKTEKVTVRRSHSPDNTDRRDTERAEKEEVTILREKGYNRTGNRDFKTQAGKKSQTIDYENK
jgi:hypothetical protein